MAIGSIERKIAIKPSLEECELVETISRLSTEAHQLQKEGQNTDVVLAELAEALAAYGELRNKRRNASIGDLKNIAQDFYKR